MVGLVTKIIIFSFIRVKFIIIINKSSYFIKPTSKTSV